VKIRLKHLLAAAIPYWLVQIVILVAGYTDGSVVLRVYFPIFVVCAALLLLGLCWVGHGICLAAEVGLLVEWLMKNSGAGGRTNTGGIIANIAILLIGIAVSGVIQLAVEKRKKKKAS